MVTNLFNNLLPSINILFSIFVSDSGLYPLTITEDIGLIYSIFLFDSSIFSLFDINSGVKYISNIFKLIKLG